MLLYTFELQFKITYYRLRLKYYLFTETLVLNTIRKEKLFLQIFRRHVVGGDFRSIPITHPQSPHVEDVLDFTIHF